MTQNAHSGAVNRSTTASVQMGYADGSTNTIRATSLTCPNGRAPTYNYGTSGGISDSASLIDSDGAATHLADESYLGLGTIVQQNSPRASLNYTLINPSGDNDPVTGDIYSGLDLFGRVKDCRWRNTATSTDLSRVEYGYNRASSLTWRANPTDSNAHHDWLYGYDGLQRVSSGTRGTLNSTDTSITSPQLKQCWTLDATGNWQGFRQSDDGTNWTLQQSRSASTVNEITGITNSVGGPWVPPVYDAAGNMTTIPQPGLDWADLSVDQWASMTVDDWSTLRVGPGSAAATYDAWNRLMSLTDSATGQTIQQNQYDGRNYRTVSQNFTSGTLAETRHYYYTDGWQVLEERLGTSPDTAAPDRQFVWGLRYIDDLVCRDRSVSGGTVNERLYGCQDANWNITAVVDTTGAVQERYEYDPYGNCTFLTPTFINSGGSNYASETLYAGYRWETASGLYAVRNRFYHPRLGTWLTRDPVGDRGGVNLYEYVGGNPTFALDPFGLAVITDDDIQRARDELTAKGVPEDELALRMKILENVRKGRVFFPKNDHDEFRNEVFWKLSDGGWWIARTRPCRAINALWIDPKDMNGIRCFKYSKLIILKSYIDLAGQKERDAIDAALKEKEIPNDLPKEGAGTIYRVRGDGEKLFTKSDLLPGDQIWFDNPYFLKLPINQRPPGDRGSNVFYLGDGNIATIYDPAKYSIEDYQRRMIAWDSVQAVNPNADPGDFQIKYVNVPLVSPWKQ